MNTLLESIRTYFDGMPIAAANACLDGLISTLQVWQENINQPEPLQGVTEQGSEAGLLPEAITTDTTTEAHSAVEGAE